MPSYPFWERSQRLAGAAAVSASVLFAVANLTWVFDQPQQGAGRAEISAFYELRPTAITAAALLSLVAYAVLIVFAAAWRQVARHANRELLGDLAVAATVFAAAMGAGAEAVNMAAATRAEDGELTAETALVLFDISYVLGSYAFAVGLGLIMVAVGLAALTARMPVPAGLGALGVVLGLTLITPVAVWAAGVWTLTAPVLFLLACGVTLLRARE